MMSYRTSLLLACLLMMDANMWCDLETVSLFTYGVGSNSQRPRVQMVTSGVSGNVLALHQVVPHHSAPNQ